MGTAPPPAEGLVVDGPTLRWGDREAALDEVLGFHERYRPWRGDAVLKVAGPGWVVPWTADHGARRRALRDALPEAPFTSDWGEGGAFPTLVLGRAPGPATALAAATAVALAAVAGAWGGPALGLLTAVAWWLPYGALRGGLSITEDGLGAGPPWAPRVAWFDVEGVGWEPAGRGAVRLVVRGPAGRRVAVLPEALLPVVRGRVRRLGGLDVVPTQTGPGRSSDLRYVDARAWAHGLPWGALAGVVVGSALAPDPWVVLRVGLPLAGAAGLVGAAVEARAAGWGEGGVLWLSLAWGLVLLGVFSGVVTWGFTP